MPGGDPPPRPVGELRRLPTAGRVAIRARWAPALLAEQWLTTFDTDLLTRRQAAQFRRRPG
ncbi:MAG: hypothetical protein KY432_10700, partial [Acidobacteria bacterium]|nr:hypothetical protein [Acidobacteriota bacterium]